MSVMGKTNLEAPVSPLRMDESAAGTADAKWKSLCKIGGAAALVALSANLLDVILGFGETEIIAYGTRTAIDWFALAWFVLTALQLFKLGRSGIASE
jgi:hypothetical protein